MTKINGVTITINEQTPRELLIAYALQVVQNDYCTLCDYSDEELIEGAHMMSNEQLINYINEYGEE